MCKRIDVDSKSEDFYLNAFQVNAIRCALKLN